MTLSKKPPPPPQEFPSASPKEGCIKPSDTQPAGIRCGTAQGTQDVVVGLGAADSRGECAAPHESLPRTRSVPPRRASTYYSKLSDSRSCAWLLLSTGRTGSSPWMANAHIGAYLSRSEHGHVFVAVSHPHPHSPSHPYLHPIPTPHSLMGRVHRARLLLARIESSWARRL